MGFRVIFFKVEGLAFKVTCALVSSLTRSTASWSEHTSHNPSHAMIQKLPPWRKIGY